MPLRTSARILTFAAAFSTVHTIQARAQAVTIGTGTAENSITSSVNTQTGFTSTWGQTFRTPDALHKTLTSWTFWSDDYYQQHYGPVWGYGTLSFKLEIVEWVGSSTSLSSPLFSSDERTPTSLTSEAFQFDVGLTLDPTKVYLAFIRPTKVAELSLDGVEAFAGFYYTCAGCGLPPSTYSGGSLISIASNHFDPSTGKFTLETAAFEDNAEVFDSRFQATFDTQVTPEPATWTMLGAGLAIVGVVARRRQRKAARGSATPG